jgi:hypothetical protein
MRYVWLPPHISYSQNAVARAESRVDVFGGDLRLADFNTLDQWL